MLFDDFFDLLMSLEGGYSDHPSDRGARTNYGITEQTLKKYNEKRDTRFKIESLTVNEAKKIYKDEYFDCIDPLQNVPVYYHYFDVCVNSGYGSYVKCRDACKDDIRKLVSWRKAKYQRIVNADPSQYVFLKGWFNRINRINKHFNIRIT